MKEDCYTGLSGRNGSKPPPSEKFGILSPWCDAWDKNSDIVVYPGKSDLCVGDVRQYCTAGNVHGGTDRNFVAAMAGHGRNNYSICSLAQKLTGC